MNSNEHRLTFTLCYGLVCGPMHGSHLKRLLIEQGYQPSKNQADADIVITHSAGCWLIPASDSPQLVVYVGAILNTALATSWLRANKENLKEFIRRHNRLSGCRVLAINFLYALTKPRRNFAFWGLSRKPQIHPPAQAKVIFIANHNDPWPRSQKLETLIRHEPWTFISTPGAHDDIFIHPETYAAIINYYAKQLLV